MTGGDGSPSAADNTQELAELFDATLKFTSVLKKKGVSQSTLTVGFRMKVANASVAARASVKQCLLCRWLCDVDL